MRLLLALPVLLCAVAAHATTAYTCKVPASGAIADTTFSFQLVFDEAAATVNEGTAPAVAARFSLTTITWALFDQKYGSQLREFNRATGMLITHDGQRCYSDTTGSHCYSLDTTYQCTPNTPPPAPASTAPPAP